MEESNIDNNANNENFNSIEIKENLLILNEEGLENKDKIKRMSNHSSSFRTKNNKVKLISKKTFSKNVFEEENKNNKSKKRIVENTIIEENENNNNFIKDILSEFLGRNSLIKKAHSSSDLTNNFTLEEKQKNIRPLKARERKSNINELNNLNEIIGNGVETIIEEQNEIEDRMSIIKIDDNLKNNSSNINTNNEDKNLEEENEEEEEKKDDQYKKLSTFMRSRSFFKEKEMTNLYFEENEHKNNNIIYNSSTNQLHSISSNLLLKKIIFEDLLKKRPDNIYHFCQQCFCFIKIDVFLGKILNCYKFYRKKNIAIEKITNLIDFLNALILEMFEYYKIIPTEYFSLIKNIYNNIISDLIINSNSKVMNEDIPDKKFLINENLVNDYNEEEQKKKFNNKKIEDNNNENKEKEESMFFDKDYIIIEKEKDKDSFDENIYNEEKEELNEYIYTTFLRNNFETTKTFNNQNIENFSLVTQTEKLLVILSNFTCLFESKRPNLFDIENAKKYVSLFKYITREKDENENLNLNKINSNSLLRRSNCLTSNLDKNIGNRKYLCKGIF